ncbi:hypothetical protein lerEdw1_014279 [Lerista edwardsae]|nr:hypothetical protein lerEdw1_014281 [Lerista edwardsae]KAJ6633889.1 hypothetical protein lerEdw1_014279 [Lerista edwardsae]
MADAANMSGGVKEPEQPHRPGNSSGLSGAEKRAEAEDSTQNGCRRERSRSDEKILLGAMEDGGSLGNGHRKNSGLMAHVQPPPPPPQLKDGLGAALPRTPEDLPLKKNFQIPRKSKEKRDLFQKLKMGLREFDDIVNILHSAHLDLHSKESFTYNKASLVHNELLEKDFVEKRRELKQDGRTDKELAETYAFLMVERTLVQSICENGLQVGHSKITVLGSPSMGIYLSRYSDLLQANTLEPGATGDIIIFKVIKGKMKTIYDNLTGTPKELTVKNALDPTPKHECHVLRNANKINSILNYRAYERTQYYFYEYETGFNEIRKRPRHVCPYAIVSFSYKDEKSQNYTTQSKLKSSNVDKVTGKNTNCFDLYNKIARPEKLDVEMVMSIEHLTKQISPLVLYKETYSGAKEEFKGGMYCSLYELVEQIGLGSSLEGLLQKLERDKLVIVKPLIDRGYLLLLSPCQMASPYGLLIVPAKFLYY